MLEITLEKTQRSSLRIQGYDYSQPGAYFVTILVNKRRSILGEVEAGYIKLSSIGEIVLSSWLEIPDHFPNVELGAFMIMPNHMHGIILINESSDEVRATQSPSSLWGASPLPGLTNESPRGPKPGSLGAIIGSFKSAVSKRYHLMTNNQNVTLWHRNYYEHIIRDEKDLQTITDYILTNPQNWQEDEEFTQAR